MMNSNNENEDSLKQPDPKAGGTETSGQDDLKERAETPGAQAQSDKKRPALWNRSPLAFRAREIPFVWQNVLAVVVTLVICISITVTYQGQLRERIAVEGMARSKEAQQSTEGKVAIRVFYPSPEGLIPEDRWVEPSVVQTRMVESAVLEYLKGPSGDAVSYVPEGTQLLGLYKGSDGIIYMDLSHEFRSKFQGDAYGEFLLLRGLYESVMSNADDISGLKVLIEGVEADTIGGHISLDGTLGSAVSSTLLEGYESK